MTAPIKLSQVEVNMHLKGTFLCYGSGIVSNPTGYTGTPFEWIMHQNRSIHIQFHKPHTLLPAHKEVLGRVEEVKQELRLQLKQIFERVMPLN